MEKRTGNLKKFAIVASVSVAVVVAAVIVHLAEKKNSESDIYAYINGRPLHVEELYKEMERAAGTGIEILECEIWATVVRDTIDVEIIYQNAGEKRSDEDRDDVIRRELWEHVYSKVEVTLKETEEFCKGGRRLAPPATRCRGEPS